jgi:hypothetical protein
MKNKKCESICNYSHPEIKLLQCEFITMKKWICANMVSLLYFLGCGAKANAQQHCRKTIFYIKCSNPTIDNHSFSQSLHLVKEINKMLGALLLPLPSPQPWEI